jgi:hypothetical protein
MITIPIIYFQSGFWVNSTMHSKNTAQDMNIFYTAGQIQEVSKYEERIWSTLTRFFYKLNSTNKLQRHIPKKIKLEHYRI